MSEITIKKIIILVIPILIITAMLIVDHFFIFSNFESNIVAELFGVVAGALATYFIIEKLLEERKLSKLRPSVQNYLAVKLMSVLEPILLDVVLPSKKLEKNQEWFDEDSIKNTRKVLLRIYNELTEIVDLIGMMLPENIKSYLIDLSVHAFILKDTLDKSDTKAETGWKEIYFNASKDIVEGLHLLIKSLRSEKLILDYFLTRYDKAMINYDKVTKSIES